MLLVFFFWPGVHHQPSEEVCPGDVIHRILFGWDGPCSNLSIQMVWQHTKEARETIQSHKLNEYRPWSFYWLQRAGCLWWTTHKCCLLFICEQPLTDPLNCDTDGSVFLCPFFPSVPLCHICLWLPDWFWISILTNFKSLDCKKQQCNMILANQIQTTFYMKSNSNVISTDGSQLGLPRFTSQILKLLLWSAASCLSRIHAAACRELSGGQYTN